MKVADAIKLLQTSSLREREGGGERPRQREATVRRDSARYLGKKTFFLECLAAITCDSGTSDK